MEEIKKILIEESNNEKYINVVFEKSIVNYDHSGFEYITSDLKSKQIKHNELSYQEQYYFDSLINSIKSRINNERVIDARKINKN